MGLDPSAPATTGSVGSGLYREPSAARDAAQSKVFI